MPGPAPISNAASAGSEPALGKGGFSIVTQLALLTAFWLVISAAFAFQVYALGIMPWSTAAAVSLFDWGPWILCSPLVIWLTHRLPLGPKTWRWALPAHLGCCLLLVLLIETASAAIVGRREELFPPPPPPQARRERYDRAFREDRGPVAPLLMRLLDRARVSIAVYWMLVAATHALAQQRRSLERERRAAQAEALLAEARLETLQAQFQPHFLFNTLNTIAQLVYENPAAAEDMIASLSELLRTVLSVQQRREVPLHEELSFIERYCSIQRVRFSDRLRVEYAVDPAVRDAIVPALILQPLVENAIIHGIAPASRPGTVFVRARRTGGQLELEVADTGAAGSPESAKGSELHFKEGVGLGNTRARLAALHGAQQSFALHPSAEGGVSVRILIPLRLPPS